MKFAPGQVVNLKSGGQSMTVVAVDGDAVECIWLGEEGDLFRETIPAVALESAYETEEDKDAFEAEPVATIAEFAGDDEEEDDFEEDDEDEEEDEEDEEDDEEDEEDEEEDEEGEEEEEDEDDQDEEARREEDESERHDHRPELAAHGRRKRPVPA
jgi:uncharacterized protein YodC (DUF2158 family)